MGSSVLAVDIGGTKLAVGVGAADGEIRRQLSEPTRAAEGAAAALDRAIALARDCLEAELAAGGTVDAVGVSTMGYTFTTHVELAPNVPGWDQLRIPEALEAAFPGLPVAIANDVRLAAQAELSWGALREAQNGIYLNLGSGIAAGIVAGGQLIHGSHGTAGEVGYSLFRGVEERLAAQGAAPFEAWFGGAGAARRLAAAGLPGSVAEVVARRHDDPAAQAFLDELWTGIGVLAANLCCVTDPAVLALGGGYMRDDSGGLEHIRQIVNRAVPHPPTVVRARFGADASLRGAVAAALAVIGVPT